MLATRMRMSTGADFYPYKIDQSCRFNDDDSAYLFADQPQLAVDRNAYTLSCWVKRANLVANEKILEGWYSVNSFEEIGFHDGKFEHYLYLSAVKQILISTAIFRDPTSWYHIFFRYDSAQAIASNRSRLWVNGVEITVWDTETRCNQDQESLMAGGPADHWTIGRQGKDASYYLDGYLSEYYLIDSNATLLVTDFGQEKNGIWIPKKYTGSYGTNSFYLDFADSADLGKDVSGNNNDFTSSGLAANDQVEDSPTNNYPVLSPINKNPSFILANGNLNPYYTNSYFKTGFSTMALPTSGKWYFEYKLATDLIYLMIGLQEENSGLNPVTNNTYIGADSYGWSFQSANTIYKKYHNASAVTLSGDTPSSNDVMQLAVDVDVGKVWFGVNNAWLDSGDPVAGTNEAYSGLPKNLVPGCSVYGYSDTAAYINFGQLGFAYTPPTGYKALCSKNLPTPSIKNSAVGFDVITYEGNSTVRDITDLSFQPDLIWIKNRDVAYHHAIQDSVRGFTTNKKISSNEFYIENAADIDDQYGYISAVNSTGFTLSKDGTGTNDWAQMNKSTENYVAWCFRMGIKYGFDIQSYTGTGVAHAENHDLGGVPELIIVKNLDVARNWAVYHHYALNKTDPETDYGLLNQVNAWADLNTVWNDIAPTSTQFTLGTNAYTNENTKNHIAYLWRSIPQFSKVFSYTGNGNANGPFVHCGFKPRYIMIKDASAAYNWWMFDTERDTYNLVTNDLHPNINNAAASAGAMDILSNGFKLRDLTNGFNNNGNLHIGIAYAEQSGKWSNAR